ncbi:MAG: hypothetical protein WC508_06225 [Patescibacteria group bacterium]
MPIEKQYICNGTKYTFRSETISLPVSIESLPPTLKTENCELRLKSSFHISLVPIGKLVEKFDIKDINFKTAVISDFCNFVKENDISFVKHKDEFRFVAQNERKSVILMAEVSNLSKFFDALNQKYKLNTETPPAHITLYTLQPDIGIFITDSKDLKQLTKVIENPIKNLELDFS